MDWEEEFGVNLTPSPTLTTLHPKTIAGKRIKAALLKHPATPFPAVSAAANSNSSSSSSSAITPPLPDAPRLRELLGLVDAEGLLLVSSSVAALPPPPFPFCAYW